MYGVLALSLMMVMYWLERRRPDVHPGVRPRLSTLHRLWLSIGSLAIWVVEAIWCVVAAQRFRTSSGAVG
jgi:hypothetical protein